MVLALCNANGHNNDITLPQRYFALHFNHVDLKNLMVPLTTLLVLHDTNTSIDEQSHCTCHFGLRNAIMPLMIPLAMYDTDANTSGIP